MSLISPPLASLQALGSPGSAPASSPRGVGEINHAGSASDIHSANSPSLPGGLRDAANIEVAASEVDGARVGSLDGLSTVEAVAAVTTAEQAGPSRSCRWHLELPAGTSDYRAIDNHREWNRFLEQLEQTAEFRDPSLRPAMAARVDRLLAAVEQSEALRSICNVLVESSSMAGPNRAALTLNDMELARLGDAAATGNASADALYGLGRGMFRLQVLEEIIQHRITVLQTFSGACPDAVEVRLGYHTQLAQQMELPGVGMAMLWARDARQHPAWLQAAIDEVTQREQSLEFENFLVDWQPWQKALRSTFVAEFAALPTASDEPRLADRVDAKAQGSSDADHSVQDRRQQEAALMRALTRQWRDQQGVAGDPG